jgi:hypothetical protein
MDEYATATELNQLAGAGAASWIALDAGGFSVTGQNRSSKYPITPSKREETTKTVRRVGLSPGQKHTKYPAMPLKISGNLSNTTQKRSTSNALCESVSLQQE